MPIGQVIIGVIWIVMIDLTLAGDNAVVIAMAVRSLEPHQRRIGSICGAAGAVVLRIGLTFVTVQLLNIQFLKLAGGLFVLWIAAKVLVDTSDPPDSAPAPKRLVQAIWYIVFTDLTMSTDNIFAIAGASNGHPWLMAFGLCLSIPFVVLSANLIAMLMDRYPATIYLGAGILGQVGGEMILGDPFVKHLLHPSDTVRYIIEGALALALIVGGKLLCDRRRCR
jgi:YjbE family integral membrane protein